MSSAGRGDEVQIHCNPYIISNEALAAVYESAGYGMASQYLSRPNFVTRSFPPGVFGFFALDGREDLIGFARVFSDNVLCSWIAELCVRSNQDVDAVRRALLRSLVERFGHTAIYTEAFEDEIESYQSVGIVARSRLTALSREASTKP
jgi:hypothetical protein